MATIFGLSKPVGMAVAPGGAAATPLGPFPGMSAGDQLVVVRHISDDLVTNTDVTSDASIVDDGKL